MHSAMMRWIVLFLTAFALMLPVGTDARPTLADRFGAGRDANGEPCNAARSWNDPRTSSPFDIAYVITCRGVAASRRQGATYAYLGAVKADDSQCGEVRSRKMAGMGDVGTRLCYDSALGTNIVRISFKARGRAIVGEAVATALGPLELTLTATVTRRPPPAVGEDPVKASIDIGDLPLPPAAAGASARTDRFDPAIALQAGISLNYRGQFIEASRLLNDALSRLPENTPPLTRAELLLEAGLADSNISQFDAAEDHFKNAEELMANAADLNRLAFLESKRATYRGLDLINRRDWKGSIALLSEGGATEKPLRDPAVLSNLNRSAENSLSASVSSTDAAQLSRLLIEAQRNWALSVAYLATGDTKRSRQALDQSLPYVAELQRNVSPEGTVALKSRLERQYGRVAARAHRLPEAIAHFDCAIAILQGVPPVDGRACLLDDATVSLRIDASSGGPLLAETQLERAGLLARTPNANEAAVIADYDTAIDSLVRSGGGGSTAQPAIDTYLDLLVRRDAAAPSMENEERFFRATQAIGEPAIARQVAQLQNIVTANSTLGAKARDRAEAEREIIRLRYAIAAVDPADIAKRAALDAERQKAEAELISANLALAADPRFRAVDDQSATIEEIRAALRTDEYFLKVTQIRNRAYAVVIGKERTFIYRLDAPAQDVDLIAQRVRQSIRDGSGKLPFFDVAASYALFNLIAGPAESALANAGAIVVDPSGPLENLPAGVLVTNKDSVSQYLATRETTPNDYSKVAFLGAHAELSSALSPRSFLITRKLPPSAAPKAFIGFGENAPAALAGVPETAKVSFGTGCDISYAKLAEVMNSNRPVSAAEIAIAAQALGVPGAPEVTRAAFTDVGLLDRSDQGEFLNYQVLHFATHGVPETRAGICTRIPPSLVTTLAPPGSDKGRQSDGLLSLPEVAELRLDANLVVLSACETASGVSGVGGRLSGQDESAATLDGLVRGFVTANARAVIATYWQVPATDVSDEFIASFYSSGRSETIGAALRDAQRRLIAAPESSHPYFWGAYFLVGDGSKTMLTPQSAAAKQAASGAKTAL